ncbi:MAG TPA: response regulator transcription factor [Rhodocyclaceae bacterium]|nr:response regulator transcription factor [Rhodocyclaceae bacterium]
MNKTLDHRLIALAEDDPLVARTLGQVLGEFGFKHRWFRTGTELLRQIPIIHPALCIVDLGLPDRDGLDVVKEIQQHFDCGVLILTGRGIVADKVLGLELGADDYMVKPFEPRELVARVRSILRRYERSEKAEGRRTAYFEGWRFDPASFALVSPAGSEDFLGTAEARLLLLLLEKPNRILTREQLAGTSDLSPMDRSIDVRISRLRKRLNDDPHEPKLIKTVYGAGYLMSANVSWETA